MKTTNLNFPAVPPEIVLALYDSSDRHKRSDDAYNAVIETHGKICKDTVGILMALEFVQVYKKLPKEEQEFLKRLEKMEMEKNAC